MTIGESHKTRLTSILSSSIIRKIKDVRKQYHSNNEHIVTIDQFGFKIGKTHCYLFFCRKEIFNNNFYLSLRNSEGYNRAEDKTIC